MPSQSVLLFQQQNIANMGVATMLPSEMTLEDFMTMEATAVTSLEGEVLILQDRVSLSL